ncbi:MAG: PAS domain S-box protein [Planctomycetota bacterium]|jgi:PAS domain S-box-containing protein
MRDNPKTKAELLKEVKSLRKLVAELRQTEEVLGKSEEKYHSLINNIPDVLWTADSNGNITFISPNVKKISGYKPEDICVQGNRFWFGRIHPDDVEKVRDAYKALFENDKQFDTVYRFKRKDGKWIWLHDRSIVTYEKDGVVYADGILSDITEQKKREKELRDSEGRYRTLFQGAAEGIIVADIETMKFKYVNPAICKMLDYTEEELNLFSVLDIHRKEDLEYVLSEFKAQAKGEKTFSSKIPCLRKDGTIMYADVNTTSIMIDGRQCNVGFFTDITERMKAEEEIEKFKRMADRSTFGYAMSDLQGNLTYINDCFARMHGYTTTELIGENLKIFHTNSQMKNVRQLNKKLVETGEGVLGEEVWHVRRDGTEFPTMMSNWVLKDPNGNPCMLCATAVDITKQKKAEDALRESEERYRILVENQTDMIVKFDPEGVLLFVSPSYCKTFGKSQDELIGKKFIPLIHEEDRVRVSEVLNNVYKHPYTAYVEERALTKEGWRWQAWLNTAVLNNEKKVEAIIGVGRDITERKKAEDAVRESEKRFREIFENTEVGVYRTTPYGQILMANPALVHMLGYSSFEELRQRNLEEEGFEPQYQRSIFKEEIEREGKIVSSESIWTTRDGKKLYVLENARVVRDKDRKIMYYEGTVENITKSKQAEEELDMYREKMAHAERLASLGTLSATLAHKLNQPLTTIRLSIENSLAELQKISCPSTVIEDIKDGLSAVSDVALTVNSFRDFARKSSKDIIGEVNLNSVAERILKLLKESARRAKVALCLENMEKLPPILSNEKDIEQLFFALVENAIQAADSNERRRLVISGDVIDECIELRFADDCGGIALNNLDKIFQPFFTTRPVSERTGLGLCIVEHIVSGAGGKVRVESDTGKGSTFFITLPLGKDKRS